VRGIAVVYVMTPQIAASTERSSNFHRHLAEKADHILNTEEVFDEGFHPGACLRVSDIKVD